MPVKHKNTLDDDVPTGHISGMKLGDYIKAQALNDVSFGRLAGIHSSRINRFRRGKAAPSWDAMEAIYAASHGCVAPNDFAAFLPPPSPDSAPADPQTLAERAIVKNGKAP